SDVLPAPFGPTTAQCSPSRTCQSTPARISVPPRRNATASSSSSIGPIYPNRGTPVGRITGTIRDSMRRLAVIAAALVALAAASSASASEIVTRDASSVSLKVDRTGHALVTYRQAGQL